MLKLAALYKDQIKKLYLERMLDDKYKYWHSGCYSDYEFNMNDSTWNGLDFVSVNKNDKVLGYFSASIRRGDEKIGSLSVMNFYDMNITFSKDFYQFLTDLFVKFNFRKISFSVVRGNPAEKMYDKYIEKYNGRIIGIKKKDIKLMDNLYYDLKLYEIFKEDFEETYKNKK